jgi:dolichyl-phosphate beta-glucosyltransferase
VGSEVPVFLSVVIPAFNEEHRIEEALRDAVAYLSRLQKTWELLVVDDGSTDRTADIVRVCRSGHPEVSLISLPENRGKGEAVREGMLAAQGQYRLFLDADRSISLAEFDAFLPHVLGGTSVVLGFRIPQDLGGVHRRSLVRKVLGMGFRLLCRSLLVWEVKDYTCAFKCFSAEAAQGVFSCQRTRGWAFDAEIVALTRQQGWTFHQVPVQWNHNPASKVRILRDIVGAARELATVSAGHWNRPSTEKRNGQGQGLPPAACRGQEDEVG